MWFEIWETQNAHKTQKNLFIYYNDNEKGKKINWKLWTKIRIIIDECSECVEIISVEFSVRDLFKFLILIAAVNVWPIFIFFFYFLH